jgi:hypothetical protein
MINVGRQLLRRQPPAPTRLGVTTGVAASMAVGVMVAAVIVTNSPGTGAVPAKGSKHAGPSIDKANMVPSVSGPGGLPGSGALTKAPPHRAAVSLVLTAADHSDCPASATACVDLTRHITWLL